MKTQGKDVFRKYTTQETFDRICEYTTVTEMWCRVTEEFANNTAIVDGDRRVTFAELEADVAGFRTVLMNVTEGKKVRIGLYGPNSYDFVKAYLAITTIGCTAVILPPQLPDMAVLGCCLKYGLSALVYHPALKEKTRAAAEKLPHVKQICTAETQELPTAAITPDANDPCVIMFTGGTTGKSKGAMLSNDAVMQGTINGCYGLGEIFEQRYLLVLPLSHVFGLIRNLMCSLYTGSTLFICQNNKDMFRDIAVFKPTVMVMVPALAEMALTLSKKFGRNMLGPDMKYIICGAAAVSPYLIKEYASLGTRLLPGYGLTESANLVSGNPEAEKHPDSVGIPYPNQELRIVDGELWLKGRNMMIGYIGEEGETPYEDGWFKTGDLVRIDEDGFLYITGRIKEVIVLDNGENVSPQEVEAKFNELACVQDTQVFEDVDENGKHFLALEAVPRETEIARMGVTDVKAYVTEQLQRVNEQLPGYQRVSRIEIRDKDFDRSPSMKILRYKKC